MKHGRGKFVHHEAYIKYQYLIANHANYRNVPGAFSENGKPAWQVSSGKTTQLYRHYEARVLWWTEKADELGLPGSGKECDRWTTAARLVHPTGFRPCLICGEEKCVGYYYANSRFVAKLKAIGIGIFEPHQSIDSILLTKSVGRETLEQQLRALFPERSDSFRRYGLTPEAFRATKHIRTAFLSPGFMGNPPYRFDGFHDYCTSCRKPNDPGRSDANMASYGHDRRTFEYWAEGNWTLADKLYSSIAPGTCNLCGVSTKEKLSPDHIGPLACGFKHIPCFRPVCKPCNSSKNRHFTLRDVRDLLDFETKTNESVACWYARPLWDMAKNKVASDPDAKTLSTLMRANQDLYFRCLSKAQMAGRFSFLCSLLSPSYAFLDYDFINLKPSSLSYDCVKESRVESKNRQGLFSRSIRIAFDSIRAYSAKPPAVKRRRSPGLVDITNSIIAELERVLGMQESHPEDTFLSSSLKATTNQQQQEKALARFWENVAQLPTHPPDLELREFLERCFSKYADTAVALL